MSTGCQGDTSYDASYEPYWTYRADRLEEFQLANFQTFRTRESPGDHNLAVHVPVVAVQDSVVIAKVDHVMEFDHWITTIYFRDTETGRVFYLKELLPIERDPGADKGVTVQAPLPDEVQQFAVFAYCNKHELWMSDVVSF
jgi:desulfoferrodoxin (superoxide reductase-like protein)